MDEKIPQQRSTTLDDFFDDWVVRMERLRDEKRSPELLEVARPRLGLVPNCGSLVQARERDDELGDMGFYARNIRAFRAGEIDHVQNRPNLTLVHST